jgi:hypothetical protein
MSCDVNVLAPIIQWKWIGAELVGCQTVAASPASAVPDDPPDPDDTAPELDPPPSEVDPAEPELELEAPLPPPLDPPSLEPPLPLPANPLLDAPPPASSAGLGLSDDPEPQAIAVQRSPTAATPTRRSFMAGRYHRATTGVSRARTPCLTARRRRPSSYPMKELRR